MSVEVQFGQTTVENAQRLLTGVENGLERAVFNSLKRTESALKNASAKAVTDRYALKQEQVKKYEKVRSMFTQADNYASASILFSGYSIPLIEYSGTGPTSVQKKNYLVPAMVRGQWTMQYPQVASKGRVLKGSRAKTFKSAFTAQMRNGYIGIFERTGGVTSYGSDAIHQLMGLSVPSMLNNDETKDSMGKVANETFQMRMDHEVVRILNGWGGKK